MGLGSGSGRDVNLGSNRTVLAVFIPRERFGNAVTGGWLSDAVIEATGETGRIRLPDSQICPSWSVGIGFKVWKRIDRSRRVQEEAAAVVEVDESSLKEVRPKVEVGWVG